MANLKKYEFWFIPGSQDLYGPETLEKVGINAKKIADAFDNDPNIPGKVICKPVVRNSEEITKVIMDANNDPDCTGIITWMHTFSPSKMWIRGLSLLQKPYLHINTQYNKSIPWDKIDMDYMNLHQSAHGDREHGFIGTRMGIPRKVVVGHWSNKVVTHKIGSWMRSAIGVYESKKLKVLRLSDNMRNVAVTEGDKVEAEIKLGWSVNHWAIGDLVAKMDEVTDAQIDAQMDKYAEDYEIASDNIEAIRYQAKIEVALRNMLEEGNFGAFTTNFEDLYGMKQLPGLAAQDLMKNGYGFGAEGDWKTAAMTRIIKLMSQDRPEGTAFMEDYTYNFEPGNEMIMGAHMLEVCPSIAHEKPRIEVHPLSIGGKEDPARLVFNGTEGSAIVVTLIDLGGRFRMIVNDIECITPEHDMPNLPVARVLWKPLPDLTTSAEAWILAGGAHHSVLTYAITAEEMKDFAEMLGIECIHINADTNIDELKKELRWNDIAWRLKEI
ncbi:MAG TPA: L-arabinose isomerase [Clostridiales bacterium]|nr:L-arabinose isomerase [Clostridiales bacterium]